MKVRFNQDATVVEEIKDKIKANDGYCPCAISRTEDTICICKNFREQIKHGTIGQCHCGLYEIVEE